MTAAVVLAAGRGTRMKSKIPKVLHRLVGRPMIGYPLEAVRLAGLAPVVVVVGHGAKAIQEVVGDGVLYAEQVEQLGTGHAVIQGLPLVGDAAEVVVLYGDGPLIQAATLLRLIDRHRVAQAQMTILTAQTQAPDGLGRIARDGNGRVVGIVEEAVATPEILAIKEVNLGLYCFAVEWLRQVLPSLPMSPRGEYYLTDLAEIGSANGAVVETVVGDAADISPVNDRLELAEAEQAIRWQIRRRLMHSGVTLVDPSSVYVDAEARIAADTVIMPNTIIAGRTVIGEDCQIGPNSHVIDSRIGAGCRIWASVVESSDVEDGVTIGPFSHLRPGTYLATGVEIGNFAEIKNSSVGDKSKIHHFGYIGDASIGREVNIGAGTVTCNYDAETEQKHRTVVDDGAALGSDTMLVAPVRVGAGAMTGSGAVVTDDVPPGELAVGAPARLIRKVKRST